MPRALAILAVSFFLLGFDATEAKAQRVGPLCFSVVVGSFSLPDLLLEVFLDSVPYGQVFLGTARTLTPHDPLDTPYSVTAYLASRNPLAAGDIRISIVGSPALARNAFILGGQLDSRATPPSGPAQITIPDANVGTFANGQFTPVGALTGTMSLVACP
jgi:hypothetical protein